MSPLVYSLWITLIGMGLVFISILLLWGLMEALMRLTARFAVEETQSGDEEDAEMVSESPAARPDQKKRAAAVAVAVALHLRRPAAPAANLRRPGSAWQALNRIGQLNGPTHIQRKPRGRAR